MKRVKPEPRLAAAFADFTTKSTELRILTGTQTTHIHLLQHASTDLRDLLLVNLSPEDYYVCDAGVGVDTECLRLLRAEFESLAAANDSTAPTQAGSDGDSTAPATQAARASTIPSTDTDPPILARAAPRKRRKVDRYPWRICEWTSVQARLRETRPGDAERTQLLQQLSTKVRQRLPRVTRAHLKSLEALAVDFPNFTPAIDEVLLHLRFRHATRMPLDLPHLLLAGPPGIGKTEFARRLAETLGLHFILHSLAEMTASFMLTGSHRSWSGSAPGIIAKALVDVPSGQLPMILFDELDKVHVRGIHPPHTALLGLLERKTAERFRDECLDLELNVRPMVFILTCNELAHVQPALRSRLKVVPIVAPTQAQMPAVIRSVDRGVRDANPALKTLFHPLDDDVVARLGEVNPRTLSGLLIRIYGTATIARRRRSGKARVTVRDVDVAMQPEAKQEQRAFGFMPPE